MPTKPARSPACFASAQARCERSNSAHSQRQRGGIDGLSEAAPWITWATTLVGWFATQRLTCRTHVPARHVEPHRINSRRTEPPSAKIDPVAVAV